MITRKQLIKKYIDYFKSKNHKEIENASLIPENDPTVLFTTAGMHPIVPFLLGQKHPQGKRLVNVQRCIRTGDIEEVGDATHHTFFEMLGNWSLGDYFKEEAIQMSFEFLTKILKIPKEDLTVSCFKGDKNAPKDTESEKIWKNLGIKKIKFFGKEDNWWGPAGKTGPCGPDTEMFVKDIEIWNDVLMEYNKNRKGRYEKAKQQNIDTGMGVERTLAIINGFEDNYLTELWQPLIKQIEKLSKKKYGESKKETQHMRIVADHIKAAIFILAEGTVPGNAEQGYVLRRLIRRAIRYEHVLGIKNSIPKIAEQVFKIYPDYTHIQKNKGKIIEEFKKEEEKFEEVLEQGIKIAKKTFNKKIPIEIDKMEKLRATEEKTIDIMRKMLRAKEENKKYAIKKAGITEKEIDKALITGKEAFYLYQSFGFPKDMILDLSIKQNLLIDLEGFDKAMKRHQELSRTASAGQFKSGLADDSEKTTKLHTAAHLLIEALKKILKDPTIIQRGSNINPERMRLDFSFPRKLTEKEVKSTEDLVNKMIKKKLKVKREDMSPAEAKKRGACGIFDKKYGDVVSVYTIESFSKEICTGPHVENTKELGKFKISKETSSSSGVRRIKAKLE
jgi:alanyl-tRNA synthetase